jgi:signal transduction histidine kinase
VRSVERLVDVVQELSLARSLERIVEVVRGSARALTGADGTTFVLREHGDGDDVCFYVDEDAIGPLWKGRRFQASSCISGWAMLHRRAVVIDDVRVDPRIPLDFYAPTFVKSLVIVPIRSTSPIGAIGCYWGVKRKASPREVALIQALADCTSVAVENVEVYADLERRVLERTEELAAARAELDVKNQALVALARRREELSALVVHDIKGPACALMLRAQQRLRQAGSDADRRAWTAIYVNGDSLARLATNLLDIARSEDCAFTLTDEDVAVESLVREVAQLMEPAAEARGQHIVTPPTSPSVVHADADVLRRVLQNLVENALAHNELHGAVCVDARDEGTAVVLTVSDEGPGIPAEQRERIFDKYARIQCPQAPRCGRGLGLAFCRLAVEAHGGRIWVEDAAPHGCRFCVRLPRAGPAASTLQ